MEEPEFNIALNMLYSEFRPSHSDQEMTQKYVNAIILAEMGLMFLANGEPRPNLRYNHEDRLIPNILLDRSVIANLDVVPMKHTPAQRQRWEYDDRVNAKTHSESNANGKKLDHVEMF